MEISFEAIIAITGIVITTTLGIIWWLDKRIARIETNVAAKQNGDLQSFMRKADSRHRKVCRRQHKLETLVHAFIDDFREERAQRIDGELRTRAGDNAPEPH